MQLGQWMGSGTRLNKPVNLKLGSTLLFVLSPPNNQQIKSLQRKDEGFLFEVVQTLIITKHLLYDLPTLANLDLK